MTVNDPNLELRLRTLRGQGMDPERRYYFPVIGYNYRLTNLASALLCAQLERGKEIVARRRAVYRAYDARLAGLPGIGMQPVAPWAECAPWLYCITVDEAEFGRSRDELAAVLAGRGIETRPFFLPIHELPPYREASRGRGDDLPVTRRLAATGMNLPTYAALQGEKIDFIADTIRKARN